MKFSFLMLTIFTLVTGSVYAKEETMEDKNLPTATFAGGCFWCMQPFFDSLKGAKRVLVGYTGGQKPNPTYDEVCTGTTGHAEAIEIVYDPKELSYEKLLQIFWHNIDPTVLNQQFSDHGTQYRSAIFYHNEEQKRLAEESKKQLAASGKFNKPIVTEIVAAAKFYPAEEYHQHYYKKKPMQYQMYHDNSGRNEFFNKVWGKENH